MKTHITANETRQPSLTRAVIRKLGGTESMPDIVNHGASGGFSGFTYYADTVAFYKRHKADIMKRAEGDASDFGTDVLAIVVTERDEGQMRQIAHLADEAMDHHLAHARIELATEHGVAVELRAANLGIAHLYQGVEDKRGAYTGLLTQLGLAAGKSGCMGDDLLDLPLLTRCGFAATVAAAPEAVRKRAHYVARAPGGHGAVREVCEFILHAQGALERAIEAYLQ
jgi:3-deoxy-D-manno-octulosonate 8-phosphate phosphatase (KDO 8-P phosphatase)